ncbi:hypothetical protein PM082_016475 [Marasmius tenuissimus]|nr:hypothetical protein PM082_016475 [Marasmius tenuissimus]
MRGTSPTNTSPIDADWTINGQSHQSWTAQTLSAYLLVKSWVLNRPTPTRRQQLRKNHEYTSASLAWQAVFVLLKKTIVLPCRAHLPFPYNIASRVIDSLDDNLTNFINLPNEVFIIPPTTFCGSSLGTNELVADAAVERQEYSASMPAPRVHTGLNIPLTDAHAHTRPEASHPVAF